MDSQTKRHRPAQTNLYLEGHHYCLCLNELARQTLSHELKRPRVTFHQWRQSGIHFLLCRRNGSTGSRYVVSCDINEHGMK